MRGRVHWGALSFCGEGDELVSIGGAGLVQFPFTGGAGLGEVAFLRHPGLPTTATEVDGVEGHVSITHNRARAISSAIIMVMTVIYWSLGLTEAHYRVRLLRSSRAARSDT
jgi:hypothetical protein